MCRDLTLKVTFNIVKHNKFFKQFIYNTYCLMLTSDKKELW